MACLDLDPTPKPLGCTGVSAGCKPELYRPTSVHDLANALEAECEQRFWRNPAGSLPRKREAVTVADQCPSYLFDNHIWVKGFGCESAKKQPSTFRSINTF